MKRKAFLSALVLASILAVVAISSAAAAPKALSASFSKDATPCGVWWFDVDWNEVWIEGQGRLIQSANGGLVMTCHFTLDLDDPHLLSREQFCSEDWAKFMCRGNGALVDNRTTCNIVGAEVHNGTVVAGPSGEGMFVCHVK